MAFPGFFTNETRMPLKFFDKEAMTGKSLLILIVLILLGFIGNYFPVPLFFGADFLFGSVFVLLVLYFFSLRWGMLAAVLAHACTLTHLAVLGHSFRTPAVTQCIRAGWAGSG